MNDINKQVADKLKNWAIPFAAHYCGECTRWEDQRVDAWRVIFGKFDTEFYTGLGLRAPQPVPTDRLAPRPGTVMYERLEAGRKPVAPTAADVLSCLLNDAHTADQSFADWASEFGYDTDSRKTLEDYEACCKIGQSLRTVFTHSQREELRELLQDY
jgi:hypothetical protein